ncbi:hypothetical protein RISK_006106 [Rhodopirellula islandica]|uniref:Uncharacterized protein n=1 Tax=Rhodopirellula islandica TaxID=595434 RepID=A0A0J1B5C8_RHOIS|nr:hypothetical protein RISK_006106 [Rhodopirellula islandica]
MASSISLPSVPAASRLFWRTPTCLFLSFPIVMPRLFL